MDHLQSLARGSFARNSFTGAVTAILLAVTLTAPTLAAEPVKDGKAKAGGLTVSAQGLIMTRDASDDLVWVADDNNTGTPIDDIPLGTSDGLHGNMRGGAMLGLEGSNWQVGGFWIKEFQDSKTQFETVTANNLVLFEFFTPTVPPLGTDSFDDADEARASYRSQLWGVEANATRKIGSMVKTLVGVRYLDLKEKFQIFYDDGAQEGNIDSAAHNHMLGLQAGAELAVPVFSFLTLDAFGKLGAMANSVKTDLSYGDDVDSGAPRAPFALEVDDTVGVFMAEAGAGASVHLGRFSVTLGYRGLYLDGVALAPGQINIVNSIYDENTVEDANHYSFWHGGHAGVKIRM